MPGTALGAGDTTASKAPRAALSLCSPSCERNRLSAKGESCTPAALTTVFTLAGVFFHMESDGCENLSSHLTCTGFLPCGLSNEQEASCCNWNPYHRYHVYSFSPASTLLEKIHVPNETFTTLSTSVTFLSCVGLLTDASSVFSPKPLLHLSHIKGFSSLWILWKLQDICWLKKPFSHIIFVDFLPSSMPWRTWKLAL